MPFDNELDLSEEQQYENELIQSEHIQPEPTFSTYEAALRKGAVSPTPKESYYKAIEDGPLQTNLDLDREGETLLSESFADAIEQRTIETGVSPDPRDIESVQSDIFAERATRGERMWAEQLENWNDLTEDQQDGIVVNRYVQRKISEIWDESGLAETAVNIGDLMLIPDETVNSVDFVNKVMGTATTAEGVLNSADNLIRLGQAFQQLDLNEQVAMFEVMKDAAVSVTDNELQQMFLLMGATGDTSIAEEAFNQTMDKLVVAGVVGKVITSLTKATRMARSLAKAGEAGKAATILDEAAKGNRPARELQASRLDAAASVLPTTTDEMARLLNQAPEGVASEIRDVWSKIDAVHEESLNYAADGIRTVVEGSPRKVTEIKESVIEKIKAENPTMEHLQISDTPGGLKFDFEVIETGSDQAGVPVQKSVNHVFTRDDIEGGFKSDRITFMGDIMSGVYSPNKLFSGDRPLLVQAFERIANAQSKVKSKLTDEVRIATKGLNKKEKHNLEKLLLHGDKNGKVYSYTELVDEGIGGIRVSSKEAKAYLGTRRVIDNMWKLKNKEVRDRLLSRGAKLIYIGDQRGFATTFDDIASAVRRYTEDVDFKKVYDPLSDSTVTSISPKRMETLYNKGFVLTKLENTNEYWRLGGNRPKWAFVDKTGIKDLPPAVLNYKTGYVPRIYDDAYWFVRKTSGTIHDGNKSHKVQNAVRYFDNRTDADKFRNQIMLDEGLTDPEDVRVLYNREPISSSDMDSDVLDVFGGLFASPRKKEALKFGLEGEEARLVDPLEALQQYMFHLGNRVPVSQFRVGIEEKWMQSFKDIVGKRPEGSFKDSLSKVDDLVDDAQQKKFLEKSHEQISMLNGIPHAHEQALQGKFRSLGRSLEAYSPNLKGAAKWMYTLSDKNPIGAAKAAAHHALLGVYSMAQFPVQALGATVAFSINPTYAAKGSSKWLAFSYLDNITDPTARASVLKKLANSSSGKSLNLGNLEEEYKLWQRSGYKESVLVTNGDYASLANGLPYDGNLLRRAFDKGTFFFKAGELANMRISFATAMERWKDLNKGKALDDNALKAIFARSEQFRLNMGQGNKAAFQKGALSIPLQFQQVNTKFFEAISSGSHFTTKERMKLFAGQGMLFGAMGIPFAKEGSAWLVDALDIEGDLTPEELNGLKRGFVGWTVNNLLGIDAEISGRVAVAGGFTEMIIDSIFEKHDLTSIMGPAGSVLQRAIDGPLDIIMNANKYATKGGDLSLVDAGFVAEQLAWSVAEIPSSTRNAILAYDFANSGLVKDGTGKVLWAEDPEFFDVMFQAMGFQAVDKQEFYELMMNEQSRKDHEKAILDRISRLYTRAIRSVDGGDKEMVVASARAIGVLSQFVEDPATIDRMTKSLISRFKADDDMMNLLESAIKNENDFSTPSKGVWNIKRQEALTGEL